MAAFSRARYQAAERSAAKTKGRHVPAPVGLVARGAPIAVTRRDCRRPRLTRTTASSDQGWLQDHRGRPDRDHQDDQCQCSSLTPSTWLANSRPRAIQNGKGATSRRLLGAFPTCMGQTTTMPVPRYDRRHSGGSAPPSDPTWRQGGSSRDQRAATENESAAPGVNANR